MQVSECSYMKGVCSQMSTSFPNYCSPNVKTCIHNLSVLYFNVRSLIPKIDHLRVICASQNPGFVCIVETWLNSEVDDSEICIQGYSIVRLDRSRHGGGLIIYVNNMFTYSVLFKGNPEFEFVVLCCKSLTNNPDLHLALFYRPPNSNISLLETLFSILCTFSPNVFINLVIVGDFNINYLSTPNYLHDRLSSVMSSFNLLQVVSEPTRISTTSSLIDFVFVSSPNMVHLCETIPPLATSDHLGIHLILSSKLHKSDLRSHCRKLWRYDQANFDQAIDLLDSIEWDQLLCDSDPDKYWNTLKHLFLQIMDMSIPHTTVKTKKNIPWMTHQIRKAMKKRNTLFRQLKQGRSNNPTIDRARYTMMRNKVVSMLRNSKQEFFNKLNNANANQFWKILRLLNWNSSAVPTLQDCDTGTAIDTSVDKANALNTFFHSCFNHNFPTLSELPHIFQMELPAVDCPVDLLSTEDSVFELLSTLDTTKSSGSDGISAKMLKRTAISIAFPLSTLINLSISTGKLRSEWKVARVAPVPKPGKNKNSTSGYRPISVLPVATKVIEKHVKKIIMDHLANHAPISSRQWGFMTDRSTISALIKVVDDWSKALDQGSEVCVVFFDVSKAFDKVPHLPLIQQLQELYVDPYLIRWLIDYLSNRYQFVAVDGETSKQLSVVSGVPQGSVLGPLLFILYINNISTIISPGSELNMFADDVALYRIINSVSDYTALQGDINSISSFMDHKHLNFNVDKCRVMLISRKRSNSIPPPPLYLNTAELIHVTSYKYLGVYSSYKQSLLETSHRLNL